MRSSAAVGSTPMKQQQKKQKSSLVTIGLDLGDRRHRFCVLDGAGKVVEEGTLRNERVSLAELSRRYGRALIVMEAGCHSPGISRFLEQEGCRVLKRSRIESADPGQHLQAVPILPGRGGQKPGSER